MLGSNSLKNLGYLVLYSENVAKDLISILNILNILMRY